MVLAQGVAMERETGRQLATCREGRETSP